MSAFSQPRKDILYCHQTSSILPSILSFTSHLGWFSNKVVVSPRSRHSRFLFQFVWHVSGTVLLLRRSGDESAKAPREEAKEEGGRRAGITPCPAVMPIYSPWHLRGHALTSAGIPLPLCARSCVFSALRGNSTIFHVHYKSFREAPRHRLASSRLAVTVVWQCCRAAVWGQTLLAWQWSLLWSSH